MNYEKKYKEALERAKKFIEANPLVQNLNTWIKETFPELKEPEDEKVRKEIVEYLKKNLRLEWATWLEKQGEQKPADKVEPKFNVGDWVVYYRNDSSREVLQVYDIRDGRYYFTDNVHFSWSVKECDEKSHLWTIQDAKDGDVLANNTIVLIVDHLGTFEHRPIIYSWYFANSEKFYGMGTSVPDRWEVKGFTPATKEQCNLLFQKMKEAGYEWDAENKELKKIEQKPVVIIPKFRIGDNIKTTNEEPLTITKIDGKGYWSEDLLVCGFDDAAKWELVEQKPADKVEPKCEESKTKIFDAPTPFEDKLYVFVAACEFLAIPSKIEFILEHSQEILDAAREQIGKEQKPAWSEEDEKMLQGIWDEILANKHNAKECEWKTYDKFLDWLKSLKTKVQPKQEWSEKDEEELEIAIDTLKESGRYDSAKWVQSLKQRIGG